MHVNVDFEYSPLLVIWEVTRSCALACRHCRASAINQRDPRELSLDEGKVLLDGIRAMGTPLVVFTGGDPLQRDDLEDLIRHAVSIGLRVGAIPATTERLTRTRVQSLKDAGLDQMAISLDGPTAAKHDGFRRVAGCYDIAMQAAGWAAEVGLPLQVNTVFAAWNYAEFDAMAALVERLGVVFWEVFFLVPTGRGSVMEECSPEQTADLFDRLRIFSQRVDFIVKVTEAPNYRVNLLMNQQTSQPRPTRPADSTHLGSAHHTRGGGMTHSRKGVNAGKGFCFVDHVGDVYPSGFLPIRTGNVRESAIMDIYRYDPLFRELRDPALLKGHCGVCDFSEICGGSRARAYAVTGDYLASEPRCPYAVAPALA